MRTVGMAILSVLLLSLSPTLLAATSAGFTEAEACRVGPRTLGPAGQVADCHVGQDGSAELVACVETACELTFDVLAAAHVLPRGAQSLSASVSDGTTVTDVCAVERVSVQPGYLQCRGTVSISVTVASACRFVTVESEASANELVSATVTTVFRVCRGDSVTPASLELIG